MKIKHIVAFIIFALFLSVCIRPIYAADVTVTVNPNNKTISIPKDFLGLSIDPEWICNVMTEYHASPVLTQLFANLSPAVLRVGGASVENTMWRPDLSCSTTVMTPSIVDDTITLANTVNWKLIWGVRGNNASQQTIDKVASEAAYISPRAGHSLLAFELGNEPESVFFRNNNPDYTTFSTKWNALAAYILSQNPSAPLSGSASTTNSDDFFSRFIDDDHTKILLATHHLYPFGGRTAPAPVDAASKLSLMTDQNQMLNKIHDIIDPAVKKATQYNLPMRIDETNSIWGGGTKGASDTFASALWAADYMFTLLEHGVVGVNFHGDPAANMGVPIGIGYDYYYYSPISNAIDPAKGYSPFAEPEYYAMLLFKYAASDGHVVPVTLNTKNNVTAHAVVNTNGTLRIILINKETSKTVNVAINTTKAYTSANIMRLAAPSLTTTITSPENSTVTLGKNPVAADGTWSPQTPDAVTLNGSSSTITLAPFRAAVVTYTSGSTTPTPTPKSIPGDIWGPNKKPDGHVNSYDSDKMITDFGHPYTIFDYNILVGNFGK